MFFFRRGELTDEKERETLDVQEVGDEFQKGLALALVSIIFILISLVLFITFGVYSSLGNELTAKSLRIGGESKNFYSL